MVAAVNSRGAVIAQAVKPVVFLGVSRWVGNDLAAPATSQQPKFGNLAGHQGKGWANLNAGFIFVANFFIVSP
jgi:hypothetical protein